MLPAAAISTPSRRVVIFATTTPNCFDAGKCHNLYRARRNYLFDVASDGVGTRSWTMTKLMVDDIDVVMLGNF
jgi:hypothetical protein